MKAITGLFFIAISVSFIGCNGGGGATPAASAAAPAPSSPPPPSPSSTVRSQIFSDTAVTSFTQTAGVAYQSPTFIDSFMSKAYAIDGNISCVDGAPVSFLLDAFGNSVLVDTTCNSQIDLSIRQRLLESLAGKRMLASKANGNDIRAKGRVVTFNAVGSFWTTYENIASGAVNTGHNEHLCKDKLTFDHSTGSMTIEHDVLNSLLAQTDTTQGCLNTEFMGATLLDYKKVLPFRFKNGRLEADSLGTTDFIDSNVLEFCIDQDADNTCD